MFSAEDLWSSCWTGVSFDDASPEDQKMFRDHAESLELYFQSREF